MAVARAAGVEKVVRPSQPESWSCRLLMGELISRLMASASRRMTVFFSGRNVTVAKAPLRFSNCFSRQPSPCWATPATRTARRSESGWLKSIVARMRCHEPAEIFTSWKARSVRARFVMEELTPPRLPLPKRIELAPRPKS